VINYSVEFREMIVTKSLSQEMTQKQLIKEYRIIWSTLPKWLTHYHHEAELVSNQSCYINPKQ